MVAVSWAASSSSLAVAVTVCAVSQLSGVKVRLRGSIRTSLLPVRVGITVTGPVGSDSSTTW